VHVEQRAEPSSAVDHPAGTASFRSNSTASAPQEQLNTAMLHGTGAGVTMYSAVVAILAATRRLVNVAFGAG
jgi:hypothetical protein